MKKIKKTKDNLFLCEECGYTTKQLANLSAHIKNHYSKQTYFDKFIKEKDDDKCKICKNKVIFYSISCGYANCCSSECSKKYRYQRTKEVNLKKYGVANPYQRKDIQEKIKKIHIKKLGVEYPTQSKNVMNKSEKTCLKNHGVKNVLQLPHNKEKALEKMVEKYGVKYAAQNPQSLNKIHSTRRTIKQYKNIWYQGSYELDFLEKFYNKFLITKAPSIPYKIKKERKVYHPDFFLPSLNLIIEIKSSYILTLDKHIKEKEKSCIDKGYNYILILDKNYSKFYDYIQELDKFSYHD
jgi:hypothetical protein